VTDLNRTQPEASKADA